MSKLAHSSDHYMTVIEIQNDPEAAAASIQALQGQVRELEALFDLRWKAGMRAIKDWQEATGQELVWPDHADLCVHLMGVISAGEKASADKDATIATLRGLIEELTFDDDPCRYDHDGNCQAHLLEQRPCPHDRAAAELARDPDTEKEENG